MTAPTPFTERMNELIAWAVQQSIEHGRKADALESAYHTGQSDAFREVANHLRQLSQGAEHG